MPDIFPPKSLGFNSSVALAGGYSELRRFAIASVVSVFVFTSLGLAREPQAMERNVGAPFLLSLTLRKSGRAGKVVLIQDTAGKAASVHDLSSDSGSSAASQSSSGLSVADVAGIFLFMALIITHFCFCRKGIYPESFALCVMSAKSKNNPPGNKQKDIE